MTLWEDTLAHQIKVLAEENEKLRATIEKALDILRSPATDWSEKGDEILVDIERILEGNDEKEEVIKE